MIVQANQGLGVSAALLSLASLAFSSLVFSSLVFSSLVFSSLAVGGDARGDGAGGFLVPRYAVGTPDGVVVVEGESRAAIPGTTDVEFFAWDRDGASIVASVETELVRIDVADGKRTPLVAGMSSIRFLDVDMSTGRVAFSVGGSEPDQGWRVWICDSDGGSSRPLGPGYSPSFTPDGRVCFEDFTEVGAELFSIDPDEEVVRTSSRTPLFDDGVARYTVSCAEDGSFLAWSTAGRLILRDEQGAHRSPSPEEGTYDRFPSFSPDGRFVLFFRSAEDRETMVLHELATGTSQTLETLNPGSLASFAPPPPRTGPDFVALARQNATRPLLERSGLDPTLDFPRALWLERDSGQWENSDAVPVGGPWFFNGVRWLLPSEANALTSLKMGQLFLPDLRYLDRSTAEALGEWSGGPLWMDGLSRLDAATLDALLGDRRLLVSFGGLSTIDVDLAERFAGVNGSVRLDGVTHLSQAVAVSLARWAGNGERFMLSLDGLVDPDPAVIRILASSRGWGLSFGGIRRLTPALLGALSEFRGAMIDLDGVTEVGQADVALLKSVKAKWVELRGLRDIAPEVRAELEASELPYFSLPPSRD